MKPRLRQRLVQILTATCVMTASVMGAVVLTASGCKRKFDAGGKSFVGLSSRVSGGGAPSFDAVSKWFQAALSAPGDAGAMVLADTPGEMREGLVAYATQQVQRIKDFQGAVNDRRRLEQLLDRETQDLLELIVTLVDPSIRPQCSSDILVKLVAQPGLRELMDQSAQDPLDGIFQTDRMTLQREMPTERANFLASLTRAYIDPATGVASQALVRDLKRNCAWLTNFLTKAGWPPKGAAACEADSQVTASGDAPLFLRLFDNVVRAMAASAKWQRENPGVNPYAFRRDGPLRMADGMPFVPPLARDWYRAIGPAPEQLNCFASWSRPDMSGQSGPRMAPTAPTMGACGNLRGTPAFVDCMRHSDNFVPMPELMGALAPQPFIPVDQGFPWQPNPVSPFSQSAVSLGLQAKQAFVEARRASGETEQNTLFLSTFAPPVLNQGTEGACTAYAAVGSGWAAVLPVKRDVNFDPQVQWNSQGQSTSYNKALSTARETGVHGGSTSIPMDPGALKSAIDSGYPVYAGCGTDSTWRNVYGASETPRVNCQKQGQYGHAFWIGGYVPGPDGIDFLVRNSWGPGWGNQGVALLSASDIANLSIAFAIDAGTGVQSGSSVMGRDAPEE